MLRADFHTHTTFCDGKSTPGEMVEAAYKMGMTDFGVSGHADFSFCLKDFGMPDRVLKQYREELYRLRDEYAGRMNIYIGIELDCLSRKRSMPSVPPTVFIKTGNTLRWTTAGRN